MWSLLRAQCIWGLRKPTTKERGDFSSKAMVHVTPDHKEARASPPHLTGAGGAVHTAPRSCSPTSSTRGFTGVVSSLGAPVQAHIRHPTPSVPLLKPPPIRLSLEIPAGWKLQPATSHLHSGPGAQGQRTWVHYINEELRPQRLLFLRKPYGLTVDLQ